MAKAKAKEAKKIILPNCISLDSETLSTQTNAKILSIGAVKFNLEQGTIEDTGFYASIDIDSNPPGSHMSGSTVSWWIGQKDPQAQQVFSEKKIPLKEALINFIDWYKEDNIDFRVWSNGADFDIPLLKWAFLQFGMEHPWKYYHSRCYRTYADLPGAPKRTSKTVHHALLDARDQAEHLIEVYKHKFGT